MTNNNVKTKFGTKPPIGAFSLIKALAMIGMPFVHVLESFRDLGLLTGDYGASEAIICSLTVFGPSVFMICMGIGLVNNPSPKRIRRNGIRIIIINFIFNLLRFIIPLSILCAYGKAPVYIVISLLYISDIYYFVGLFLILYSFLREAKLSTVKIFLISLLMAALDIISYTFFYTEIPFLSGLVGNLISVSYGAYFPLFGWCIFPCIGMLIEEKILSLDIKKRNVSFAVILALGAVILIISAIAVKGDVITATALFATETAYGLPQFGLIISITLITLGIFYFIYQAVKTNPIEKFLISYSSLIIPFYIIQWLASSLVSYYAVALSIMIFGHKIQVSPLGYSIISLSVAIVSFILTYKFGFSFLKRIFKLTNYTCRSKYKKAKI